MSIDYEAWMTQPRMLAERCRGLPLIWTPDARWFNNDWLGPTPHVHDDATEFAYLAQGSLEIEIGGSKRVYRPGDVLLMPPKKYHNYWFSGSDPVCFFVVVNKCEVVASGKCDSFVACVGDPWGWFYVVADI